MDEKEVLEPTTEPEYTVEDACADLKLEDAEPVEPEEEQATADEVPDEDPGDEADEADDEEEEDEDEVPELDSAIRAALGDNADALALWERQWKGIVKREKRLQKDEAGLTAYKSYEQALADPNTARQTYEQLGKALSEHHKWDSPTTPQAEQPEGAWEAAGFYSEKEYELHQNQQKLDERLARFEEAERKRTEERQFQGWVNATAQKVAKQVAGRFDGFEVTPAMLKEAVENLPQLRDKPVEAVTKWYAKELYANGQGRASRSKRMPEMPTSAKARGMDIPDNPEDFTIDHAYLMIGS
jgi:hypothetical protein